MSTFQSDREFLKKHLDILELSNDQSKLLIAPGLQGRIFTSTAAGDEGDSFGWINYDLIASGEILKHCNNWGGEDRYWIGPEGGQFSIFFEKGSQFDLEHWQTPAVIDTEGWDLDASDQQKAIFSKKIDLTNYSGHELVVGAKREIELFDQASLEKYLGITIPDTVKNVGFKSVNEMTNLGSFTWNEQTGMLSIWILGQLISSESNTVILPYDQNSKGQILNDSYFGKIDDDRLKVTDDAVYFKGDGKKRGKIGVGPGRAKSLIGSYDSQSNVLTIVKYSLDPAKERYVNSMWEMQEDPFDGDIVNSYNDGPLPDGTQMGPFYELETSSPVANLEPGETLAHEHATFHFQGEASELEEISKQLLGVGFEDCF